MSDHGQSIRDYIAEHYNMEDYLIREDEVQGQGGWSKLPGTHFDPDECPINDCSQLMVYFSNTDEKSCPVHGKESRIFEQMGLTARDHNPEANRRKEST